jgi:hypothetical protein
MLSTKHEFEIFAFEYSKLIRFVPAVLLVKLLSTNVIMESGLFYAKRALLSFAQLFSNRHYLKSTKQFPSIITTPLDFATLLIKDELTTYPLLLEVRYREAAFVFAVLFRNCKFSRTNFVLPSKPNTPYE